MLVLYQTQKAPPRFHGAGSFVKLGGRTGIWPGECLTQKRVLSIRTNAPLAGSALRTTRPTPTVGRHPLCSGIVVAGACGLRIADNPDGTNGWSAPTMQLHSDEASAVVKVDVLPNSALSDLRKCRAIVKSCESRKMAGACGLRIADNPDGTNGWSAPTMQLHSDEASAVVKVDVLPNSALSDLRKCRAIVKSCESRKMAGACGLRIADNSAATNGSSAPTMQLHSGGWWSLVKPSATHTYRRLNQKLFTTT